MTNYLQFSSIVEEVADCITGRIAEEENNVAIMASYALKAGHGDHLEIGTLFGGSAIVVALLKERHGIKGKVICVDPLNGFYYQRLGRHIDDISGLKVNRETLEKNIDYFELQDRIEIIEKLSIPWPDELKGRVFVSAYIDGDHWDDVPLQDWLNVKDCVTRFVIFDNYDNRHPEVVAAINQTAAKDPDWKTVLKTGISYVLERVSNVDNRLQK